MEFNIKLSLYFEIKDSYIYGGEDSIGYLCTAIEFDHLNYEKDNMFNKKETMEKYISEQIKNTAKFCKVPVENVRGISKEEYEENTDDD